MLASSVRAHEDLILRNVYDGMPEEEMGSLLHYTCGLLYPLRIPQKHVTYCMKCYEGFNWHLLSAPIPWSSCVPNMGLANILESNQSLHDLVKAQ